MLAAGGGCFAPGVPPNTLPLDADETAEAKALAHFSGASLLGAEANADTPEALRKIDDEFRLAHEAAPDNREILQSWCNALETRKRFKEEQAALEGYLARHPDDLDFRKAALRAAAFAADAKAVLLHGRFVVDAPDSDPDLFRSIVNLAIFKGLDDEALAFIRRYSARPALAAAANESLIGWAARFLDRTEPPEAGPQSVDAATAAKRAQRLLESALQLDSGKPTADDGTASAAHNPFGHPAKLALLGMSLAAQGRFDAALEKFREAAALDDMEGSGFRSYALALAGNPSALAKYRASKAPPLERALVEAALAEKDGSLDRATEALRAGWNGERAAGRFPSAYFCAELAQALELNGEFGETVRILKESMAAHPGSAMLKNHLAFSLAVHNRELPLALRLAAEAVKSEPRNPAYLDTLAWALFKDNRVCEALQIQLDAAELDGDPEIRGHLRDILLTMGRFPEARMIK